MREREIEREFWYLGSIDCNLQAAVAMAWNGADEELAAFGQLDLVFPTVVSCGG